MIDTRWLTVAIALTGGCMVHAEAPPVYVPPAPASTLPPASAPAAAHGSPPRIMMWWGKVNQHFDPAVGTWRSDPDGRSGANLDPLRYCRVWFPVTIGVRPYGEETIATWREAGNVGAFTATKLSNECVQPAASADTTGS